MRVHACGLILLAVFLSIFPAAAGDRFEPVRELIQKQIVENNVPSVAVAVARDGEIIWEEGFGWADRENRIPSNAHVMYSLASISKPITATALMILRERGKIDLDHGINDYLGDTKINTRAWNAADATVRRVANHTSGLPLHYQFFYEDEPYRPPSPEETIRRYANLVTAPGERFQYSNLGYGILGFVISRVSGQSYAAFMRNEVFVPLGMTHSSVGIGFRLEKYQAVRYGAYGGAIPFFDFDHPAASAIYASAHDLIRFALFHLKAHLADQKAILPDEAIDSMHKPTTEMGNSSGYGIGWAAEDTPSGDRLVTHTGGMGGVSTVLEMVPSKNMAVAVLSNSNSTVPDRIARELWSVLLPGLKQRTSTPEPAVKPSVFEPGPDLSGKWKGSVFTYEGEISFTMTIQPTGDIHARLGLQLEALVNDAKVERGYLTGKMTGDIGIEDANRRPYLLELSLRPRGNVMNGAITAVSLHGRRVGNALTQWVELTKQ